jgi:hypothetical protein
MLLEGDLVGSAVKSLEASVIIESREGAENTAVSMTEPNTRCLWTDGS